MCNLFPISILTHAIALGSVVPKHGCHLKHLGNFEIIQILKYILKKIMSLTPRPIKLESLVAGLYIQIFLKVLHVLSGQSNLL